MQIVMCRQLTTTGLQHALPLTKALRARIRVYLGQGPAVTGRWPSQNVRSLQLRRVKTGVRLLRALWPAEPQCQLRGAAAAPVSHKYCFMQAVQGFSSPHELQSIRPIMAGQDEFWR